MSLSFMDRLLGRRPQVVARMPSARTLYSFRAKQDFFADEVQSQYVAGLLYRVREGNDKLHQLVQQWVGAGKVEVL